MLVAWTLGWDADGDPPRRHRHLRRAQSFPLPAHAAYRITCSAWRSSRSPLQWLTANSVLTYNIAFIASFVQAGAGMRAARALDRPPRCRRAGGARVAFTPFRVAHLAHLQWLMTGWLPLSLWALHRYFSTGAFAFLIASVGAYLLQSLTASYFTYFGLLPLAAVAIVEAWRMRPPLRRTAVHAVAAAALAAAVLAPVVSAYYRARADHDFVRKPSEIAALSADAGDYFRAHNHVALWRQARPGTGEHELFPAAVMLLPAGAALFAPPGAPHRPVLRARRRGRVIAGFSRPPGHVSPMPDRISFCSVPCRD